MGHETVKLNLAKDSECWLPCANCHGQTCHKVMLSVDWEDSFFFTVKESYQIVQCLGCKKYSFRKTYTNSEEDQEIIGSVYPIIHQELYPSRVAGRHKLNQVQSLPADVARIYDETHAALCNKQPVLAGIGIRALIETVCKEKAATGSNLEKKIDGLVSMGVLTQDGAEILHSLRILGNVAAHEVTPHSEQTLSVAMDVVEHLLKGVYILPAVASKLPRRQMSNTP